MQTELISIGTELLLGKIIDTNASHIAQSLAGIGLDLIFKTTVGDNEERIAQVIANALERVDIVITTGGLGPTVDDVTREAIARATNRRLEFQPFLLDQIAERFRKFGAQMSDNNRQQAMIPSGAIAIENPVGTAPIFVLETERGVIMTLPGVPREMEYLLEHELLPRLIGYLGTSAVIKSLTLRTAGVGESMIDSRIADLMTLANPTVGLAAHSGQTDIRITAKAKDDASAHDLIAPVHEEIRARIGDWIYGIEDETIEGAVANLMRDRHETLSTLEVGTDGMLLDRLAKESKISLEQQHFTQATLSELLTISPRPDSLDGIAAAEARRLQAEFDTTYALVVVISDGAGEAPPGIAIAIADGDQLRKRFFGWGAERSDRTLWATTHALAMLRRHILKTDDPM